MNNWIKYSPEGRGHIFLLFIMWLMIKMNLQISVAHLHMVFRTSFHVLMKNLVCANVILYKKISLTFNSSCRIAHNSLCSCLFPTSSVCTHPFQMSHIGLFGFPLSFLRILRKILFTHSQPWHLLFFTFQISA